MYILEIFLFFIIEEISFNLIKILIIIKEIMAYAV